MICDLHCDTAQFWQAGYCLDDSGPHVSLSGLQEAGVGLQVFAAYVPPSLPAGRRFPFVLRTIRTITEEIGRFPAQIALCRTSGEVEEAAQQGRIAAVLAVENGDAIEEDLDKLDRLHQLGVRIMTLVHTRSNHWVISSADREPAFDGLSPLGADVVAAMNGLGMIIDVSHAHDRAVQRVLELSSAPVVASHSCLHALCPIDRNLRDELVRGIAAGGGVVGVNFHPLFLDCAARRVAEKRGRKVLAALDRMTEEAGDDAAALGRAWIAFRDEFRASNASPRVPLSRLLDQFDYILELVGEETPAFGSDFDGIVDTPVGVEDCRGFANILAGLRERGWNGERLRKLCWSNALRVFQRVCG